MTDHAFFTNLPSHLRPILLTWIEQYIEFIRAGSWDATKVIPQVVDGIASFIYPSEDDDSSDYISEDELQDLQQWDSTVSNREWFGFVAEVFADMKKETASKNAPARPATASQLQIIQELQEGETDISFEVCFPHLNSWMAHVIIQGLVAMSEVQRNTGRREFRPGELRKAIRDYIQRRT